MKAAVYHSYGPPEVLKSEEIGDPTADKDQVLIEVRASSVNPVDYYVRAGKMKLISGLSFPRLTGADFAGKVIHSPSGKYAEGDEVYGSISPIKGGAWSEKVVADVGQIQRKPENTDFVEAASLPIAGLTALQGLLKKGKLKPDDRVLINGCSGGVGSMALQIARVYNASITGVCSKKNFDFCRSLGAEELLDYHTDDIYKSGPYDLILDAGGNLNLFKAMKMLSRKGRLIAVAGSPSIYFGKLLFFRKIKIMMTQPNPQDLDKLRGFVEEKKVIPKVDKAFTLDEADKAQKYAEEKSIQGKVGIEIHDH